jgi:O-antigen ligase
MISLPADHLSGNLIALLFFVQVLPYSISKPLVVVILALILLLNFRLYNLAAALQVLIILLLISNSTESATVNYLASNSSKLAS